MIQDILVTLIFTSSLAVLYLTSNEWLALLSVIGIIVLYLIRNYKIKSLLKRELRSSTRMVKTLFDASPDMILYLDVNLNIMSCNKTVEVAFTKSKSELVGMNILDLVKDKAKNRERFLDISEKIKLEFEDTVKTKEARNFQINIYPDGKDLCYLNLLASPVFSSQSEMSGVIIVARDITEEVNSKNILKNKTHQLKDMLESMPICAVMKDKNGKCVNCSSAFEDIVKKQGKTIETVSNSDIFMQGYKEMIEKEEALIFETKEPIDVERQIEFIGNSFWGRIIKTPLIDEKGQVQAIVVMYENLESTREVNLQRTYFTETLIHDLKTPTLAQLRGIDLLIKGMFGDINKEQSEILSQISHSCHYMLDMISILLSTYRIDSGQMRLSNIEFNLEDLIQECFNDLVYLCEEKGIIFRLSLEENIILVADRNELKKVLNILLINILHYSDKHSEILIKCLSSECISVDISFKGVPFNKEECSSMFSALVKGKSKYTTIGFGMGMYSAQKIMRMLGGEIQVCSNNIDENNFILTFPHNESILKLK